jgi:flagellar biogenesis protein FliO
VLTVPKRTIIHLKQLPKNNKTVKTCVKGDLKRSEKAKNFFSELLRHAFQDFKKKLANFLE